MKHIPVHARTHSYSIHIDHDCLDQFDQLVPSEYRGQKAVIITDHNVGALYAHVVSSAVSGFFSDIHVITVDGGERSKSLRTFGELCDSVLSLGITRKTVLIALGGGIIGDLVGYVASSLLRGIPFIQMPTTLLAQVDSSVGGKTGINSVHGKNLIGAFYQPLCVIMNTAWLKTLPIRELRAGYAEIIKYGLLGDEAFYNWLLLNAHRLFELDDAVLQQAIATSCQMKADIVARDEHETKDIRALLNLGHTFAHAIETLCDYDGRILHGEAVAIGLILAAQLSHPIYGLSSQDVTALDQHLESLGYITRIRDIPDLNCTVDDLIALMHKDKKADLNQLVFVLLEKIGVATVHRAVPENDVIEVLKWTL